MPAAIDPIIKQRVIAQYLQGESRDTIAADNGIGTGTVSNVIRMLYDYFAHSKIKAEVQGVLKCVYRIWEKDFDSYDLKAVNIERKVEVEIGDARVQFGKKRFSRSNMMNMYADLNQGSFIFLFSPSVSLV
ncbi:MAG: hypothetical protein WBZ36_07375 [Candidatus Nitrosopolaris sp.]|jgi:hypothetical protein